MQPDCEVPIDVTAPPGWETLAIDGEPVMYGKVNDLDLRPDSRTMIVKILTTPTFKNSLRARTESLTTKRLLKAMKNCNTDFRSDLSSSCKPVVSEGWPNFDEDEFKAILHSRAGGTHTSHTDVPFLLCPDSVKPFDSVASLIFVSPNDDWPHVCFAATCRKTGWEGVDDKYADDDYYKGTSTTMFVFASDDRVDMDDTGPAIGFKYISRHIDQSLDRLDHLASIVEGVERLVQGVTDDTILADAIKQLHLCNVQHVMLQRRWAFQKQLMLTVDGILSSGTHTGLLGISETCDLAKLKKEMSYRTRLVQAAETDLAVLPRRIENQFTALYNLSNQRDAKASVKIANESAQVARESARIAQATLNDSSSMKTIAVMTLIFLPATFACSFFSMTFFNWQTTSNRIASTYLWVYFAVTVPITILVLAAWAFLTKKNRQETQLLRRRTTTYGHDLEKND